MDDLKAKLEQVDDDIQALREVKMAIVQQIADSEVTYSRGDKLKGFDGEYIIAFTGHLNVAKETPTVGLVCIKDGSAWQSRTVVKDTCRITSEEFAQLCSDRKFTRYWDARKQCKC